MLSYFAKTTNHKCKISSPVLHKRKSLGITTPKSWGFREHGCRSVQNSTIIVIKIFYSELNWWTDWPLVWLNEVQRVSCQILNYSLVCTDCWFNNKPHHHPDYLIVFNFCLICSFYLCHFRSSGKLGRQSSSVSVFQLLMVLLGNSLQRGSISSTEGSTHTHTEPLQFRYPTKGSSLLPSTLACLHQLVPDY